MNGRRKTKQQTLLHPLPTHYHNNMDMISALPIDLTAGTNEEHGLIYNISLGAREEIKTARRFELSEGLALVHNWKNKAELAVKLALRYPPEDSMDEVVIDWFDNQLGAWKLALHIEGDGEDCEQVMKKKHADPSQDWAKAYHCIRNYDAATVIARARLHEWIIAANTSIIEEARLRTHERVMLIQEERVRLLYEEYLHTIIGEMFEASGQRLMQEAAAERDKHWAKIDKRRGLTAKTKRERLATILRGWQLRVNGMKTHRDEYDLFRRIPGGIEWEFAYDEQGHIESWRRGSIKPNFNFRRQSAICGDGEESVAYGAWFNSGKGEYGPQF